MPRTKSTHVDSPAAVGRRLREARDRRGLSQRDLAFPGCSPAYISRIEKGDRIPSLQLLRELGHKLGMSVDWLATGDGDGTPALELDVPLSFLDAGLAAAGIEGGVFALSDEEETMLVAALLGRMRSTARCVGRRVARRRQLDAMRAGLAGNG